MLLNPYRYAAAGASSTTWDPANKGANVTLSGGDLIATIGAANYNVARSTSSKSSGKWYFEVLINNKAAGGGTIGVGILNSSAVFNSYLGSSSNSYGYLNDGRRLFNNVNPGDFSTYTSADVIGVALDAGSGSIWLAKNNVWQGTGDPAAGTNAAWTGIAAGAWYAGAYASDSGSQFTGRFKSANFSYTPPTGFSAWGV